MAGQASATIDGQTYIGGTTDIVLLKYDQSGNKLWTKLAGTALSDQSFGGIVYHDESHFTTVFLLSFPSVSQSSIVAIDSSSNVYVTGFAQGVMNGQTYVANDDLVLVKFDSTGSQIWARLVGTSGRDQGLASMHLIYYPIGCRKNKLIYCINCSNCGWKRQHLRHRADFRDRRWSDLRRWNGRCVTQVRCVWKQVMDSVGGYFRK